MNTTKTLGWRARKGLVATVVGATLATAGASYLIDARTTDVDIRTAAASVPAPLLGQASSPTDDGASALRANLTALLQEHVYLAGITVVEGVSAGLDSAEFKASAAALDTNSVNLSGAIESVYGQAAGEQFLALWRKHIGFFVDYTAGKATGDQAKADAAKTALDGYRADFGAFLSSANPNLPKEAVAEELTPHVESLFAAIESVIAADGQAFEKLRVAAGHMPMTANVLAGAITTQFPDKFPAGADEVSPDVETLPRTS